MRRVSNILFTAMLLLVGLAACSHDTEDVTYTPIIVEVNGKAINCISMIDSYNGESTFSCDWYGNEEG
jgi:hypothetical protein